MSKFGGENYVFYFKVDLCAEFTINWNKKGWNNCIQRVLPAKAWASVRYLETDVVCIRVRTWKRSVYSFQADKPWNRTSLISFPLHNIVQAMLKHGEINDLLQWKNEVVKPPVGTSTSLSPTLESLISGLVRFRHTHLNYPLAYRSCFA